MADDWTNAESQPEEWGEQEEAYEASYYAPPEGAQIDDCGRLIAIPEVNNEWEAEDYYKFVSKWRTPWMASPMEGQSASHFVWPDIAEEINLRRVDVFEFPHPKCHQATQNREESRTIRSTPGWVALFSFFVLDLHTPFTKEIKVESTGPPRRHKFIVAGKQNSRDTSSWIYKETIIGYVGAERIPGAVDVGVDYQDSPDRYFLSKDPSPELGLRRLYRFAGYPCTQYFLLEKDMVHDSLESEGGSGITARVEKGPLCFMRKGWNIIGSFYAFDKELYGSNLYTVYSREDPFPLIQVAIGPIVRMEEWKIQAQFYAFDIPVPGTCTLTLQHCVRSIYSAASNVSRHRLTTEDPKNPWEFRMTIYVFPAELDDCSLVTDPVIDGKLVEAAPSLS